MAIASSITEKQPKKGVKMNPVIGKQFFPGMKIQIGLPAGWSAELDYNSHIKNEVSDVLTEE
jgi:hypothetical protein